MLSRGLGNVLSSPISTTLANVSTTITTADGRKAGFKIDGGRFEKLIVYVGTCYAAVAVVALFGWGRERFTIRV